MNLQSCQIAWHPYSIITWPRCHLRNQLRLLCPSWQSISPTELQRERYQPAQSLLFVLHLGINSCLSEHPSLHTFKSGFHRTNYLILRGMKGDWEPHTDPVNCKGNPCDDQVLIDIVNAVKRKQKLEGPIHNHACAINPLDIKAMQGVTMQDVPPVLFERALSISSSLDINQHDAVCNHFMFCALSSLGWTLWTRYVIKGVKGASMADKYVGMKNSQVSRFSILIGIMKRFSMVFLISGSHWRIGKAGRSGLREADQGLKTGVSSS